MRAITTAINNRQSSFSRRIETEVLRTCALVALSVRCRMFATAVAADGDTRRPDPVLQQVVAGDWRSAEAKARDQYRHPVESLTFWGLKPGMTVLEIQPGSVLVD